MKFKEKLKTFLTSTKTKAACAVGTAGAMLGSATTAFCADGDATGFKEGIQTIWDSIKGDLSIGSIVAIIGIVIGTCVGVALFWFGLRYVIRKIMAAVKKGKVSA